MGWRGFGFVHHSRTLFCRAVPNLSITIRNFFIAVRRRLSPRCERAKRIVTSRLHRRRAQAQGLAPLRLGAGRYSDQKVANRDTKVWHGATETGP